jgi:hypothetical protein
MVLCFLAEMTGKPEVIVANRAITPNKGRVSVVAILRQQAHSFRFAD